MYLVIFSGIKCPRFFLLNSFQRLGQKSLKKFGVFVVQTKTPKSPFEINRPLLNYLNGTYSNNFLETFIFTRLVRSSSSLAHKMFDSASRLKFQHLISHQSAAVVHQKTNYVQDFAFILQKKLLFCNSNFPAP